jgi:hypothetical protein
VQQRLVSLAERGEMPRLTLYTSYRIARGLQVVLDGLCAPADEQLLIRYRTHELLQRWSRLSDAEQEQFLVLLAAQQGGADGLA